MFCEGYRPRGGEQHATVVEFVEERLGTAYADQVRLFDQMRRKRQFPQNQPYFILTFSGCCVILYNYV